MPSGGKLLSGAPLRTIIQWELSQFLAGNVKLPRKEAPGSRRIVSPHAAWSSARCKSPPALTLTDFPGAGVSTKAVFMYTRGSSAGPSCFVPLVAVVRATSRALLDG